MKCLDGNGKTEVLNAWVPPIPANLFRLEKQAKKPVSDCRQSLFYTAEGFGKQAFPEWNPQGGLCPTEENSGFQGIYAAGIRLFIP